MRRLLLPAVFLGIIPALFLLHGQAPLPGGSGSGGGGGGSSICTVTGTQTTGNVLTATNNTTGCSWQAASGGIPTPALNNPNSLTWFWSNQPTGATITSGNGIEYLFFPIGGASVALAMRADSVGPSVSSFTLTSAYIPMTQQQNGEQAAGIYLKETTTGIIITYKFTSEGYWNRNYWSNPTTPGTCGGQVNAQNPGINAIVRWSRIVYNGTQFLWQVSPDGFNWDTIQTDSSTACMTSHADETGIFIETNGSSAMRSSVVSFKLQ